MNSEDVGKWMYRASWPTAALSGVAASAVGVEINYGVVQDVPEKLALMAPALILGLGGLVLKSSNEKQD